MEKITVAELKPFYTVFDNGGASFDRYTLVGLKSGEVLASSEFPFSPQGVGLHCFNAEKDSPYYGLKSFLEEFRSRKDETEVKDFSSLPRDVLRFMAQDIDRTLED